MSLVELSNDIITNQYNKRISTNLSRPPRVSIFATQGSLLPQNDISLNMDNEPMPSSSPFLESAKTVPINTQNMMIGNIEDLIKTNISKSNKFDNKMIKKTLKQHNFDILTTIEQCKNRFIYLSKNVKNNVKVIIKGCLKSVYVDNKCSINEDILKEKKLFELFKKYNPPKSQIKLIEFFDDNDYYYLVHEYTGINMLEYVETMHKMMDDGLLPLNIFKKHVRVLIYQLIKHINWLHNNLYCCHNDISLENMTIFGVKYDYNNKKYENHGQIYLINYDYSNIFNPSNDYKSKIVCGRNSYMSPQKYNKKVYNSKSNDLWSLGVCIYSIVCGIAPYQIPDKTDPYYELLINGSMLQALTEWGISPKITKNLYNLIKKLLTKNENKRITTEKMLIHSYFKQKINISSIYQYSGTQGFMDRKLFLFKPNDNYSKTKLIKLNQTKTKTKNINNRFIKHNKSLSLPNSETHVCDIYEAKSIFDDNNILNKKPAKSPRNLMGMDMDISQINESQNYNYSYYSKDKNPKTMKKRTKVIPKLKKRHSKSDFEILTNTNINSIGCQIDGFQSPKKQSKKSSKMKTFAARKVPNFNI